MATLNNLSPLSCPITRIGFYHRNFNAKNNVPFPDVLESTAERCHNGLNSSLIVLPEAFNLVGPYMTKDPYHWVDLTVQNDLVNLSRKFGVAFVAGLLDDELGKGASVARLIDDGVTHTLSVKAGNDGSSTYIGGLPRRCGPKEHRGLYLRSMICMDAGGGEAKDDPRNPHTTLCIPGRFSTSGFGTPQIAEHWLQYFSAVIVANGDSQPSVIRTRTGNNRDFRSMPIQLVELNT
jgi:hypothetical protein